MRILFVVHGFPPEGSRGTELYSFYLLKELQRQGHDVHVFYPVRCPEKAEFETQTGATEGIDWTTVNFTYRNSSGFLSDHEIPEITGRFRELLADWRPDVVHFHHLIQLSFSMVPAAARSGAAVLYTLHDFKLICPRGQMLRRDLSVCDRPEPANCAACKITLFPLPRRYRIWSEILEKFVVPYRHHSWLRAGARWLENRHAARLGKERPEVVLAVQERWEDFQAAADAVGLFISPSQTVRQKFIEAGIPADKILHSPNGYPVEHFSGFERSPSPVLRFGLIGTFIPSKGVDLLIRAFNGIGQADVILNLFGKFNRYEGFLKYEEYVRPLVKHRGIQFRGEFEHGKIARCLSEIDVLVVPSIWLENAPLTIQEAFLTGTPVIAAGQGGMAEMVRDGENGLLFKPGDIKDLRRQMIRILREPGLLERLQLHLLKENEEGRPLGIKSMAEDARFLTGVYERLGAPQPPLQKRKPSLLTRLKTVLFPQEKK